MCGRFAQFSPGKIREIFDIRDANDRAADLPFNYNAAPTDTVRVVVKEDERVILPVRWEMLTAWSRGKSYKLINIRDDTLRKAGGTFEENFRRMRCIIPADGFFEWQKTEVRKPFYIRLKSGLPMAMAGLFNILDEAVSCAVITARANSLLEIIHDKKRMPVILPESRWDEWLDNSRFDRESLLASLAPYPAEEMEAYAVTDRVNSPLGSDPEYVTRKGDILNG
ncbi:MAG: SOS response-associated peptidase [Brevinematales bacterium]|jgi:putative SOS response-associated peptidase YedK